MGAGYGRYGNFCDCDGVELCEPLSFKGRMGSGLPGERDGYADASLQPDGGSWEKYLYTYRLFGRLLYNPGAAPESWRRFLRKEFGTAAGSVEGALANASRILPLLTTAHHPSASNNAYWPEIYTNMPIVDETSSQIFLKSLICLHILDMRKPCLRVQVIYMGMIEKNRESEELHDLLHKARTGSAEAFERLFQRHRETLRQIIALRMDPRLSQRSLVGISPLPTEC